MDHVKEKPADVTKDGLGLFAPLSLMIQVLCLVTRLASWEYAMKRVAVSAVKDGQGISVILVSPSLPPHPPLPPFITIN